MAASAAPFSAARRDDCAARASQLVAQMTPEERLAEAMMDAPGVPRLNVPPCHWWNEALHGVARAGLATVFPQSIGLAATFDPDLLRRVGDVVSTEARAKCNLFSARGDRRIYRGLTVWSPNVNMFRDPRWGRGQETFGEDPYLSGVIGAAYVRGLQGNDPNYLKLAACAKHFAVHSGPEGLRHGFDASVSPRDLAEYYLPAFRTLVTEAGVESVMGAYSAINGVPCCANRWLLTDLLRGEWGFRGHVVSDVGAIHDIHAGHHAAEDDAAASRAAMAAGLDLCSETTYRSLLPGVTNGTFSSDALVPPLVRLFTTRCLLGQFDPPGATPWDALGVTDVATPAHRRLALEAAERSLVLVSNRGVLPADPRKLSSVVVDGPRALDEIALNGNYNGFSDRPWTVMAGVLAELGPAVQVTRLLDSTTPDLIVACLGITADDEGEEGCSVNNAGGDRAQYALPAAQLKFLEDCHARGKPVVAVVFGGSPVDLAPVVRLADAVILAWYPGEQGGRAVARTLFGKSNPSGRLPITFPQSYDDLPPFESYALSGRTYRYATQAPAYPFGYGLSYSRFSYDGLRVEKGETVEVSVRVKNVGGRAGEEVVQLYLRAPTSAADRRLHHLEGVARVRLAPDEAKVVTLALRREQFAVFGEDGKPFVPTEPTTVFVGGGQPGYVETLSEEVLP